MRRENHFISLTLILLMHALQTSALTFNTERLKDSQHSNYVEFIGQNPNISNAYDKTIADLNNDGIDDIISLGGQLQCIVCTVQPPTPSQPIELMIYRDGGYQPQISNFSTDGLYSAIIDIDQDGDLDIILRNGNIAYNDGQANFSETPFTTDVSINGQIYGVDWDQDGDTDIITQDKIYLNDSKQLFSSKQLNLPSNAQNFIVTELNGNSRPDVLINHNGQIQSWVNLDNHHLTLKSSLPIETLNALIFKKFDFNNDGAQDFFMIDNHPTATISILINDGHGQFSRQAFELPGVLNHIPHNQIIITDIHTIDADNDKDLDVWINAKVQNTTSECYHQPNILMIYDNDNTGQIHFKKALHSSGYDTFHRSHFRSNMATIVDLNGDGLPDVVSTGEKSLAWQQIDDQPYSFKLTTASSMQFNQHVQVNDYNQDGLADILSTGLANDNCTTIDEIDKLQSATHEMSATGTLWLGDGNGQFKAYQNPENDYLFNAAYQNAALIDLDHAGSMQLIANYPSHQNSTPMSYYIDPNAPDFINHVPLPIATKKSLSADMGFTDGDEIILQDTTVAGNIFIVEKSANPTSLLTDEFNIIYGFNAEPGFATTDFSVKDMNNDGKNDVVVLNKNDTLSYIKIWFNNGKDRFNASVPFAQGAKLMTTGDFNGDGLIDIFATHEEKNIWINNGKGSFTKTTYDQSIWLEPFPVDSQNLISIIPEKIVAKDINDDELSDLFVYVNNSLNVYINTSRHKGHLSFYKNYSTFVPGNNDTEPLNHSNIDFADFNNDGLMDFVSGGDNFITINTQTSLNLKTGLYYDPSHNGHGFTIESIGRDNLYHAIFFTYDDDGKPMWYSMLNQLEAQENYWKLDRINGENIIQYVYDYEENAAIIGHSSTHNGWMTFFNQKDQPSIDHTFFQIGGQQDMWPLQPIISSSLNTEDFSGLWWAGNQDAGWGLSLLMVPKQKTIELLAILYFYDENGQPRWLMGQANNFIKDKDITIDMKQINGYARGQTATELTENSAGSITVNLHQASNDLNKAGSLSMDIHYPDDELNDNWRRKNIPIALFSEKRKHN